MGNELIQLFTLKGIARYATHAIPPFILAQESYDNFHNLHGALRLRLSSFPAGCALIGAVEQGINDIMNCFPNIAQTHAGTLEYIEAYKTKLGLIRGFNPANWKTLM
jgi:hypothetical protein